MHCGGRDAQLVSAAYNIGKQYVIQHVHISRGGRRVQVCDPAYLIAKMTASSSVPQLPHLRRLAKCFASIAAIATVLEQPQLHAVVTEMVAYLEGWFDFEESCVVGIINPGHEALDKLKAQFSALPTLLQQVRASP